MRIAIWNLEPYFNLALEKIRKFYLLQGAEVEDYFPLSYNNYDKIYCSSIFTYTDKSEVFGDVITGGSGFDLETKLLPEIEKIKVYKNRGFTTRGCNRKCPFCLVARKEGKFKITGDIYDFWDRKSKSIILYDNNILFDKKHFKNICQQCQKENLWIDFNQGLDIRLIDNFDCELLNKIKIKVVRFSFDNIKYENAFRKKMKMITKYIRASKIMIYMLVGFDSAPKEDLERLKIIKEFNADAFVMIYKEINGIKGRERTYNDLQNLDLDIKTRSPQGNMKKYVRKIQREFARWNNRFYFRGISFETYLKARKIKREVR